MSLGFKTVEIPKFLGISCNIISQLFYVGIVLSAMSFFTSLLNDLNLIICN